MQEDLNIPQKNVSNLLTDNPLETGASKPSKPTRRWSAIWNNLLRMGLGETALRVGTGLASIAFILLVVWVMSNFYLKGQVKDQTIAAVAAPLATPTPTIAPPPFEISAEAIEKNGLTRLAQLHTTLPDFSRFQVTQYEVQKNDTIIGIAQKYNLKPKTVLLSNYQTLYDDPHRLQIGQKLNILPVDGVYHKWNAGDTIKGVAKYFGVKVDDIVNWPGNNIKVVENEDPGLIKLDAGTWVIIPGGTREYISAMSAPVVTRSNPSTAKMLGSGSCGKVTGGAVGTGAFIWPTTQKSISGYDYSPETNHMGIDIAGATGNAIFASDNGVVVYSGWSDLGYGYLVIIDHGNGWQTLYAHLSAIYTPCGTSVAQGTSIGAMGSTGRSTGPHLHFELMSSSGARVNPWSYVSNK